MAPIDTNKSAKLILNSCPDSYRDRDIRGKNNYN